MKLEFLDNVNEYGDQVIRLYNFDRSEAIKFRDAIQNTIIKMLIIFGILVTFYFIS